MATSKLATKYGPWALITGASIALVGGRDAEAMEERIAAREQAYHKKNPNQ